MKKTKKNALKVSLLGLSLMSTAIISVEKAEAVGFGDNTNSKIIQTQVAPNKTVIKFKFNPAVNSDQSRYYTNGREMYREVYVPENPNYVSGFVWYTIVPQTKNGNLQLTDLHGMLENNQTVSGHGGDYLVSGGGLNIKYGSIDPWTGQYYGSNTGTKTIKYGQYKGKKYEYRFIGYNLQGNAVGNPYFPADDRSRALQAVTTKAQSGEYWSKRNWIYKGWELPKSVENFGASDALNETERKIQWIEKYFFADYPAFKKQGDARYWANYLRPLTDPSKETGVWLGWHYAAGVNWYTQLITTPPEQPNLRVVKHEIYDNEGKLVAQQTRNATNNKDIATKTTKNGEYVSKGQTYTIKTYVKNMTNVTQNITNQRIYLEHMYQFDDKIGLLENYSAGEFEDDANAPNQNKLNSGETATFEYQYTVPVTAQPKEHINFMAKVPDYFYNNDFNTDRTDDLGTIQMKIAPENLAVEFDGYYDRNRNPVDYVATYEEMFVKYRVVKTDGTKPVNGADLQIKLEDTKTVSTNKTYTMLGAFSQNGTAIADGILKKKGDYAVFETSITPNYPKVCTQGSILSKWAVAGVNNYSNDDVAKPPCLVNPDNIVVTNFNAKPETTYLSKNQRQKSVIYTVQFDLTNYNYDKKDKTIPLVYTIDGRIVKTESVPVESLKTMKISRVLPAVNVGKGEHVVQVEANPVPRKYVEVKTNTYGAEVDPYSDNIGWDTVNVLVNGDSFYCPAVNERNDWNTRFLLSYWEGYYQAYATYDWYGYFSGYSYYPAQRWTYQNETIAFNEEHKIENIFFKSKQTEEKYGGWIDLKNTDAIIKAGYGFEMKVVTSYKTNTYNDTPKPYDNGFWSGRHVSPGYTAVDSTARLKITMPFTDDSGQPIALILDGTQTGSWYNNTTTYELDNRQVINSDERKIYINENTQDGKYNVRIETEPFYGSEDKPSTRKVLCDIENVTIEVKGSYLDDVKTHIIQ